MRVELYKYQNGQSTLKMIGAILLVFCYFIFIFHQSVLIQVAYLLVVITLAILLNNKINSLAKIMGYFLLEFDENFLYYTSKYQETKIPLQDITAVKLNGYRQDSTFNTSYPYKIVYTDMMEEKTICIWVSSKNNNHFNELNRLVQIKNPRLEIINVYPNDIDFTVLDKGAHLINKLSERIFRSKK